MDERALTQLRDTLQKEYAKSFRRPGNYLIQAAIESSHQYAREARRPDIIVNALAGAIEQSNPDDVAKWILT